MRFTVARIKASDEPMERLQDQLGGPKLWVKRDDCTGLAGGGNKTRKLEFLVGEALEQGCDMLVTQGAIQSNHVRQTAAAARRYGLECHALLELSRRGVATVGDLAEALRLDKSVVSRVTAKLLERVEVPIGEKP